MKKRKVKDNTRSVVFSTKICNKNVVYSTKFKEIDACDFTIFTVRCALLVTFSLTSTKVGESAGENEKSKPSTRFDF